MKPRAICSVPIALCLFVSRAIAAQTFVVSSTAAGTLNITAAVAGQDPTSVSASSTTYTVITLAGLGTKRITARLNQTMPAGTTLRLTLAAPPGATSTPRDLTDIDQNVVTGIPAGTTQIGLVITYTFSATPGAGVVPTTSRTITLQLL